MYLDVATLASATKCSFYLQPLSTMLTCLSNKQAN